MLKIAPRIGPAQGDQSSPTASPARKADAIPRVCPLRLLRTFPALTAGPAIRWAKDGKIKASAAVARMTSAIQRPTMVASVIHSLATVTTIATRVNITIIPASRARICRRCPWKPANMSGITGSVHGLSRLIIPPRKAITRNIVTSHDMYCDTAVRLFHRADVFRVCVNAWVLSCSVSPRPRRYKAVQFH